MKPAAQQTCSARQLLAGLTPMGRADELKVAYDSLKAELRQLTTNAGIKNTGYIVFGTDGSSPLIEFIDLKLPDATREQMRTRVVAHLEHVTINGWSPQDPLPDQIESCQPAVRNEQEIARSMQRAIKSFNSPAAPGPRAT